MRISFYIILLCISSNLISQQNALIIDHSAVAEFENINEELLPIATGLRLMFRHASVGGTVNDGLDCLQGTRSSPKECTEYTEYEYDRRNWQFQPRANSGWRGKVDDFVNEVKNQIDDFDIFSFKYCYLDGLDETADPCGKPFNEAKTEEAWNYLKDAYETLENKHPEKIFIWWTIPLTQVGQFCTEEMNSRIRNYCVENNRILFDIADIEAYDTLDSHVTNEQGWEMAFSGYCGEQKPGAQACHPNWLGKIMLAKAFWVMMANIASDNPISVKETNKTGLTIYPNPATDYIKINVGAHCNVPLQDIMIYNTLGQCVMNVRAGSEPAPKKRIDIFDLPIGIYFIKIKDKVNKFVKI
ncbi:T9SS type A sorting domain-containing protein [Bacteroidota bacterium]